MADKPRIMIIYTGGTIGMTADPVTGALAPFDLAHLLENAPKLARLDCEMPIVGFDPPLDSSDVGPAQWRELCDIIAEHYDSCDGFVILHGTDTMAYTASALSFMLSGLGKPVILTGSQLPIGEVREDGTRNLITALEVAAARDAEGAPMVQEVAIAFGGSLWRGNRATKADSTGFDAFKSFNYPPLAQMDTHIRFNGNLLLRPGDGVALKTEPALDEAVEVVYLHPGMTERQLQAQLNMPDVKGVVLRTFGVGDAPTAPWFLDALSEATSRGLVIVNITQCPAGGVIQGHYETGSTLTKAGVISGYDMTCEAALAKLMHLFGRGLAATEVAHLMQENLAGEMTEREALTAGQV